MYTSHSPNHIERQRLLSFKCIGALNKIPNVAYFCDKADVVFVQETWIMPHNSGIFDNVHSNFLFFSRYLL